MQIQIPNPTRYITNGRLPVYFALVGDLSATLDQRIRSAFQTHSRVYQAHVFVFDSIHTLKDRLPSPTQDPFIVLYDLYGKEPAHAERIIMMDYLFSNVLGLDDKLMQPVIAGIRTYSPRAILAVSNKRGTEKRAARQNADGVIYTDSSSEELFRIFLEYLRNQIR